MSIFIERYILPILATVSVTLLLTAFNPLQLSWKLRLSIGLVCGVLAFAVARFAENRQKSRVLAESAPEKHAGNSSQVKITDSTVIGPVAGRDISIGTLVQGAASIKESDDYHERPTPIEIDEAIERVAFYHRDSVAKGYDGIKVRWQLLIESINIIREDRVSAWMRYEERGLKYKVAYVVAGFNLADYPILKTVRGGEQVEVLGTIDSTNPETVHRLKDAKLKFLQS